MKRNLAIAVASLFAVAAVQAATTVTVTVEATTGHKPISPYIYGKNHGLSQEIGKATHADTLTQLRDAGFKMLRLNNGNNASKYNFRKKLSSHPDWYNNVYARDWDQSAIELQSELPGVQGMYAISMLGWAANNTEHNFDDQLYNGWAWWTGTTNNWAGTPPISAAGEKPTATADPTLYLERWPVDSSAKILDYWFGKGNGNLGLDSTRFRYWNMDNEPDIWDGTHDDVMPDTMDAEEFVKIYVDAAKKARAKFPGIKLVGPVATNEWQWFFWKNKKVSTTIAGKDTSLVFIEYFIKRVAEEQKASGVRLLDVLDYHFYPGYGNTADKAKILQLHRIWYDRKYVYPLSNGLKNSLGGSNEYIFGRSREWLDRYFGTGNGITMGVTECGSIDGAKADASVISVWYASQLGEFANSGEVEVFTPWSWYDGMFETAHLFTRYAKSTRVDAVSTLDSLVSGYASMSESGDSLTVVLVNRDLTSSRTVRLELGGYKPSTTSAPMFQLAGLSGETFFSESNNALKKSNVSVVGQVVEVTLPKTSVQAIVLKGAIGPAALEKMPTKPTQLKVQISTGALEVQVPAGRYQARLSDLQGKVVQRWTLTGDAGWKSLPLSANVSGAYLLQVDGLGYTTVMTGLH